MQKNTVLLIVFFIFLSGKILSRQTKIAFQVNITSNQPSPVSPLRFDAVKYNEGGAFSTKANVFVAPTPGLYFFSVLLLWNGYGCGYIAGTIKVAAIKNSVDTLQCISKLSPYRDFGNITTAFSFSTKLNAGDKVNVAAINTLCISQGGSYAVLYEGSFSGYKVYDD